MDSMENVDFGVDELADFFGGLDFTECLPLSCRRHYHSCIQCFSIYMIHVQEIRVEYNAVVAKGKLHD